MIAPSWLRSFRSRLQAKTRRSSGQRRNNSAPVSRIIDQLEQRTLLTIIAFADGFDLTIQSDQGEAITVQHGITTGNVEVLANGNRVSAIPAIPSGSLATLTIVTSDYDDVINLSSLTATQFSGLTSIQVATGDGNDFITGSDAFADSIRAGDGADTILGGSGNDTLDGEDGDDSIVGGNGRDIIFGGDGDDTLIDMSVDVTLTAGQVDNTLSGGDGHDSITTGAGQDSILGGAGHDLIDSGDGNDTVDGGTGNDQITGGLGNDVLSGSTDNDTISGNAGNDSIDGGTGDDVLQGDDGDDVINGRRGDDTISGGVGLDNLSGDHDRDVISGGDDDDIIFGGADNDLLDGDAGNDFVNGNSGNDTVLGGLGMDRLKGGNGNDLVGESENASFPVIISINSASIDEGDTGNSVLTFLVSLSSTSASPVTFDFTTVNGSAVQPADYTMTSGSRSITPGNLFQTISVTILGDTAFEGHETLSVILSNVSGALVGNFVGVGTILNDDLPPANSGAPPTAFADPLGAATAWLARNRSNLGLTASDLSNYIVTNQYTGSNNGVTHLYLRQTYLGLPIIDGDINLNIGADGTVLSAYSDFVPNVQSLNLSAIPQLSATQVFATLGMELAIAVSAAEPQGTSDAGLADSGAVGNTEPLELHRTGIADRLQWAKTDAGGLDLVWTINVQTNDFTGWYDASGSATTGTVTHNSSWTSDAAYNVFPRELESPLYGARNIEIDPNSTNASPFGWHDTDGVAGPEFTVTRGNNVNAFPDRDATGTGVGPDGGPSLIFDFPLDLTQQPVSYTDAATTNLFYTLNILHDVHYEYGFDEASGNFQFNNYGNGGVGGDGVQAMAQFGANVGFFNNAFMGTPPEGISPMMFMLEFTLTNPRRDSDLESAIIVHEFGHGVSNRLTGGAANAGALNALQSGGMGEGWSDWWALMFTQEAGDQANDARPIGNYVLGQTATGGGIRRFPYSFDMAVNPLTFNDFNGGFPNNEVHNSGEIWAQTLWDMNWLLVNGIATPDCNGNTTPGYGYSSDFYDGGGGNNVALQLVMDGLKFQPSNPTFVEARDAILLADQIDFGGANQRAIWTAFARRGLGFSADAGANANSTVVRAAFDMPPEAGSIRFSSANYTVGSSAGLVLCDADLAAVTASVVVTVTSSSGDSEQVTLTRGVDLLFRGSIPIVSGTPSASSGRLEINSAATLLSTSYFDINNGLGGTVTSNAFATVFEISGDFLFGEEGNDTLLGGLGDDYANGGDGNDLISGGDGDDLLEGGAGNDTIHGESGDDLLNGEAGNDLLDGGDGNDQILWRTGSDGVDVILESIGGDSLAVVGSLAADAYSLDTVNRNLRITEGLGSITISASVAQVQIQSGDGDDRVTVNRIVDARPIVILIDGQGGNDTISALNQSLPRLLLLGMNGGADNDTITGSNSSDRIDGGPGDDSLRGELGNDSINGGDGNDQINAGSGDDTVDAGLGSDAVFGEPGNDSIEGGFGNDYIDGDDGNDTVSGGFGDDTVIGDRGNDLLFGGQGNDALLGSAGDDSLDGGDGNDVLRGNGGNDAIRGSDGNDTIIGDDGDDLIDAGDGDDRVEAGNGLNLIIGGDGNDTLFGGANDDTLIGGDGNDLLFGRNGVDWLFGGDGDDFMDGNQKRDQFNSGEGNDILKDLETGEVDNDLLVFPSSVVQALLVLNGF